MCKSDQIGDFKIINLVLDSQENNLHHQMGIMMNTLYYYRAAVEESIKQKLHQQMPQLSKLIN